MQTDDKGNYFIDRDGRQFHHILNYLRDPTKFVVPSVDEVRLIFSTKKCLKEIKCSHLVQQETFNLILRNLCVQVKRELLIEAEYYRLENLLHMFQTKKVQFLQFVFNLTFITSLNLKAYFSLLTVGTEYID